MSTETAIVPSAPTEGTVSTHVNIHELAFKKSDLRAEIRLTEGLKGRDLTNRVDQEVSRRQTASAAAIDHARTKLGYAITRLSVGKSGNIQATYSAPKANASDPMAAVAAQFGMTVAQLKERLAEKSVA